MIQVARAHAHERELDGARRSRAIDDGHLRGWWRQDMLGREVERGERSDGKRRVIRWEVEGGQVASGQWKQDEPSLMGSSN